MFELAKTYKDELILGLEIRDKVANFAGEKINSLRINSGYKECQNLGVLRTNAMKSLHNWQVSKLEEHPMFERLPESEETNDDPCVAAMRCGTDEA